MKNMPVTETEFMEKSMELCQALLAFLLAKPVMGTMAPLLGELSGEFASSAGLKISSLLAGFLLAVSCGGVLGLLPAFSAVKGNISDVLREV